jgi:hypothetical protein
VTRVMLAIQVHGHGSSPTRMSEPSSTSPMLIAERVNWRSILGYGCKSFGLIDPVTNVERVGYGKRAEVKHPRESVRFRGDFRPNPQVNTFRLGQRRSWRCRIQFGLRFQLNVGAKMTIMRLLPPIIVILAALGLIFLVHRPAIETAGALFSAALQYIVSAAPANRLDCRRAHEPAAGDLG